MRGVRRAMKKRTPQDLYCDRVGKLVRDLLQDDFRSVSTERVSILEDFATGTTRVKCEVRLGIESVVVDASGCGVVDALLSGLRSLLSSQYYSFEDIFFEDFTMIVDPFSSRKRSGTDVAVRVGVVVGSSDRDSYHFYGDARSFNVAAIRATLNAVEYYLNCETAVYKLHQMIEDAKARQRPELQQYVCQLSEIVRSASYVKSIAEWKQKN